MLSNLYKITRLPALTSVFLVLFFISCARDGANPDEPLREGKLTISLVGIDDIATSASGDSKASSAGKRSLVQLANGMRASYDLLHSEELHLDKDTRAELSIGRGIYGDEGIWSSTRSSSGAEDASGLRAATSDLGSTIRFRFILYKQVSGTYEYEDYRDATAQSAAETVSFDVDKGATYKWVAYSYNTPDDITDNINTPQIETAIDKDLLYATDEFTVATTPAGQLEEVIIPILFKHHLARVAIEVNAEEFPAFLVGSTLNVTLAPGSQNFFRKGTVDLLSGAISNPSSVTHTGQLPFVSVTPADAASRVAYFYTADFSTAINNLTVRIGNATLRNDDMFITGDYPSVTNQNFTFATAVTPAQGHSHPAKIAIRSNIDGVRFNNLVWAHGNLSRDPSTGLYFVRNPTTTTAIDARYDYWLYATLQPDWEWTTSQLPGVIRYTPTWPNAKDPCRAYAGQNGVTGAWRLPTLAEFTALNSATRQQTPGWNSNSPATWGIKPAVNIPANSRASFRSTHSTTWLSFYPNGRIDVSTVLSGNSSAGNTNYTNDWNTYWGIEDADLALFGVSNGNSDSGGNSNYFYTTARLQNTNTNTNGTFTSQSRWLRRKIVIRCVRAMN